MWSPREKAQPNDASETPSVASPPPVSTPTDAKHEAGGNPLASPKAAGATPNGGIFNSFSKMLFGGEGEEAGMPEPNGAPPADPHAFITSSPRRSPAPPAFGAGAHGGASTPGTPLSVHVMGDGSPPAQTAMSPRTGSLLDTIFSPVFNSIFGSQKAPAAGPAGAGGASAVDKHDGADGGSEGGVAATVQPPVSYTH